MIGIFGANGFIGRHLVARLAGGPERVRAVSRHFDPAYAASLTPRVDVVQADLSDDIAMASALQDVRVVVQLVSTSSPGLQNRYAVSDIRDNVLPQVSFLEACVAAGVERYVFLSSGGTVYGQPQTLPIPESHPARPLSSHGMTKLVVEQYIDMYGRLHGLPYVVLRVANPFGPGQTFRKGQGLIPALLQRHAQGLPVRIINGGQAIRDFLYIDDLADAVAASLAAPEAVMRTINVGSGEGRRIVDVIEAVEQVLGQRFAREDGGHRDSDVDANVLDITLARELLGWEPRTPFMEGLRETLRPGLVRA